MIGERSGQSSGGTGRQQVVIIGAGITGLAAAAALADRADLADETQITVLEASDRLGGCLRTSNFAGRPIDEGPDAFLIRTPAALELAQSVGLGDDLVSPSEARAAIWQPRRRRTSLHRLPGAVVLGVPSDLAAFATSSLFSTRGRARAALDVVLGRTSTADDSLGNYIRARLGDEVHDRLVDALVGSIYATDTDQMSLRAVPQIAQLATAHRSLLLGARRVRTAAPPSNEPIFATPRQGLSTLVDAITDSLRHRGVEIITNAPVTELEADGHRWRIDGRLADDVVLATSAIVSANLLDRVAPQSSSILSRQESADVIMVTLAIASAHWPERLRGLSGYLVPKPLQRHVTAASFGTQKWEHWNRDDGTEILRVSLGRDGLGIAHLDDDEAVEIAVHELGQHLDMAIEPSAHRVTRWMSAFPNYRPGHPEWVRAAEGSLPAGLHLAGSSYRGIGIPACIADGQRAAAAIAARYRT